MGFIGSFIFTFLYVLIVENSWNSKSEISSKSVDKNCVTSINSLFQKWTLISIEALIKNWMAMITPRCFRPIISLTSKRTISIKLITINCNGDVLPITTPNEIKTVAAAKSLYNMLEKCKDHLHVIHIDQWFIYRELALTLTRVVILSSILNEGSKWEWVLFTW